MSVNLEISTLKSGVCEQSLPLLSLEKLTDVNCIMPGISQDQLAQEPLNKPKVAACSAGEMQKNRPHHTQSVVLLSGMWRNIPSLTA